MDSTAEGVVACVADAGATFLAPIFDELTAVVCLSGTPQSHIGIVSREYQVPCVMSMQFVGAGTGRRRRRRGRLQLRARRRPAGVVSAPLGAGWDRDRLNAWLRYHSEISYTLTMQRTALESALIPVTAYIVVACVECYRRYPEMVQEINAAMPAEEIGRAGHAFANQIDPVRLWAVPNFTFLGRTVLAGAGVIDTDTVLDRLAPVARLLGARGSVRTASTTAPTRPRTPTGAPRRTASTSRRSRTAAGRWTTTRRVLACRASTPS